MRVLVVEDERDTADALAWGLAAEGYVVDLADNGVDGLWKATENAYDVIVLDVMLPGLDGYQVAEQVRAVLGTRVFLVALTGFGQDEDRRRALKAGFDAHLVKPVDLEDLSRLLASVPPG